MDKYIYGADSETVRGQPNSLQFYSEDCTCDDIYFVNADTACDTFMKWVSKRRRDVLHVVYVHVLEFDLPEFFWGRHAKLIDESGAFDFYYRRWHITGVYGSPTFCRITNGHDITVLLVDSFSYYRATLAKAAEIFCQKLPKLKRVAGIGEKRFTRRDSGFIDYAMRDAVIAYHIGKHLEKLHQEFDLQQTVSVADMASRIFRHRFLDYTIPQPRQDVIEAALLSYHGGKNNVTVEPGWYTEVTSIDIKSAYPDAMHRMPAFANKKLYRRFSGKRVRSVPDYGVYQVSGRADKCAWPVLFSHGFKPLRGAISKVWIQGFELNEALRSREFHPSRVIGHFYEAERDHQAPALRNFVDVFYARKETETDKPLREMYKFILNAISGKFIQTRKKGTTTFVDIDAGTVVQASELTAGGMFHPFIASAVTADTRARIHRLEHQYKALHTATDGLFTQSKRLPPVSRKLGAVSPDAHGELLLIRNKCYILYDKTGEIESKSFQGKRIAKFALHGFQGKVHDLERLIATNTRKYQVNRPHRLREALRRKLTPNEFVTRDYTLKVGPIKVVK